MSEKVEEKHGHSHKVDSGASFSKTVGYVGKNPWVIVSIILFVALIAVWFMRSPSVVSEQTAAANLINFVTAQGGSVELVNTSKIDGFYEVTVKYNGNDIPVYVTLDGKNLVSSIVPLTASASSQPSTDQTQTPKEVVKSDNPKVELFVMSYCPYGTQAEKGLIPAMEAIGSKADVKIRFVHYTMHGEKEDTENFRQICIREEQSTKFLPYLKCVLNSTDPYNPADPVQCMKQTGVDATKVNTCMTNGKASEYYAVDSDLSKQYGVAGSPTLIVNGQEADFYPRSPSNALSVICSAFNNAPSECSSVSLSTANPDPGFGMTSSASSTGNAAPAANCGA